MLIFRYFVLGTLGITAFGFGVAASEAFFKMRQEVNTHLPEKQHFPMMDVHPLNGRMIKMHKMLYPESSVRSKYYRRGRVAAVAGMAAIVFIILFRN